MARFRRPAPFPFVFLTVALVVFFGGRTVIHSANTAADLELVNPLDADVPLSKKERFVSIGEKGEPVEGMTFPNMALEQTQFLEEVSGSAVSSFEVCSL